MSRNNRTPQRRRVALGLGTAAGAALAAAFISMGTAHAVIGEEDPFSDLLGPAGASLDSLVVAADPSLAINLDTGFDLIAPTDVDPFADVFGATAGGPIDTLLGAPVGAVLDPFFDQITPTDVDPFADLLGAATGGPIDALLGATLAADLDPFVELFLPAI